MFELIAWKLSPKDTHTGEIITPTVVYTYRTVVVEQENGKELTLYILLAENDTFSKSQKQSSKVPQQVSPLHAAVEALEKRMIQDAMRIHDNNISQAALALDLPRQTLQYKLAKYRI